MTTIAVTMVYNEAANLRRWLRHYAAHVDRLLVVDHGSDDGSTEQIAPAERIRIPRSPFDDGLRADLINDLQRLLLRQCDAVVYTDCDELIVPDPRIAPTLGAYVQGMNQAFARPVGFNVVHQRHLEPPLDPALPVLSQRGLIRFMAGMCKPLIARQPTNWAPGFHGSDQPVPIDPALWLFHTKYADYPTALRRLQVTRGMPWTERAVSATWGWHQRESDEQHTAARFDALERQVAFQGGPTRLPATEEIQRFNQLLAVDGEGFWRGSFFTGRIFAVEPYMRDLA